MYILYSPSSAINRQVLSGSETGTVLVWDDGLIKCQLKRPGDQPCHDGMIEFIQLDEKVNEMLTAGIDGCVRFWSLEVDSLSFIPPIPV